MPVSRILWGPTFENELRLGFSLFDLVTDREERDGSEHIQSPAGVEDSWITGRDYVIDAEVRWIPDGPNTSPVQTQLSGANSWQAFLDYARDANALRFIPDETALDFYIDNVYLVEPRKGFGSLSPDVKRNVKIKLRNATMDFHQALRGIMVQVQAGMSLTDPTVLTFTRADATTCATRIKRDGTIETVAANVLRIQWEDLDGDGVRETPGILLEGSRQNACIFSEDLTNATYATFHASVTANAMTAPDGLVTAEKIVEDATLNAHAIFGNTRTITDGQITAASIFLKAAERSKIRCNLLDSLSTSGRWADVDLATGVINSNGVSGSPGALVQPWTLVKLVNGWYRLSVAFNVGAGKLDTMWNLHMNQAFGTDSYTGDGTSGLYVWGWQIEIGQNFASSYIKTPSSSAVTRAADSLTLPFTFGPMDLTVLGRVARPVHADAVGTTGVTAGIGGLGDGVAGDTRFWFNSTSRTISTGIRTATTDVQASQSIPAGAALNACAQYQNLRTAGQTRLDVGSGFSGLSSTGAAMASFSNQTIRVGAVNGGNELYGVLIELKIASGLRTLAQMLSL